MWLQEHKYESTFSVDSNISQSYLQHLPTADIVMNFTGVTEKKQCVGQCGSFPLDLLW